MNDRSSHRRPAFNVVPYQICLPLYRTVIDKMMYRKMFTGLTLAALLTITALFPVVGYATQADQSKAEKFMDIAEKALEQTIRLRNRAQEKGANVTAANDLIVEGESLLNEAKTAFSSNDFLLAYEKAKQAQARFRDALETFEVPLTAEEQANGKGVGILGKR